jgi:hypothetical protein
MLDPVMLKAASEIAIIDGASYDPAHRQANPILKPPDAVEQTALLTTLGCRVVTQAVPTVGTKVRTLAV